MYLAPVPSIPHDCERCKGSANNGHWNSDGQGNNNNTVICSKEHGVRALTGRGSDRDRRDFLFVILGRLYVCVWRTLLSYSLSHHRLFVFDFEMLRLS